jgi:hypothetical protein
MATQLTIVATTKSEHLDNLAAEASSPSHNKSIYFFEAKTNHNT